MTDKANLNFDAYEIEYGPDMQIRPTPVTRKWMDETDRRFAYRCLPLTIANQSGWWIPCPINFTAWWDGGETKNSLRLEFDRGETRILSHFGSGIVTFAIPYLFRTPEGINLWVKGPTNLIKDGAQALEGIIETDWASSTFTMNWKLTRPNNVVQFREGEPICMVVPVQRGLAESLNARQMPLHANPEVEAGYRAWSQSREYFMSALAAGDQTAVARGWQKDYFNAAGQSDDIADEHQTRLHLSEFKKTQA